VDMEFKDSHLFTQFGKTSLEILYAPFLVCRLPQ